MKVASKQDRQPPLSVSFHIIETQQDNLVDSFYSHLFDRHPELEPLFNNTNWNKQKMLLISLLSMIVQYESNLQELEPTLNALRDQYVAYSIKCDDYNAVYESLMMALCDTYGKHWNVLLEKAWCKAIHRLCEVLSNPQEKAA